MKSEAQAGTGIERVGTSGQISLGKRHAGRYCRQEPRADGAIVLGPVVIVPESHWTVRDQAKIRDGDFLRVLSLHLDHDSAYEDQCAGEVTDVPGRGRMRP